MPIFLAEIYLVASCMPDAPLRLFECDIAVVEPFDWVPEPSGQLHIQVFPGPFTATIGIPPHVRYQTRHRARTVIVDAPDMDAAAVIARKRFLRCVAALALVSNNPVAPAGLTGPMFIGEGTEQAEPGQFQFIGGEVGMSMTTGAIPIHSLSDEARQGVLLIADLAREPDVAWLLERFADVEARQLLEFTPQDRQLLVIEYCRILEKIGQLVAPHIKTTPDAALESIRAKLLTDLSRKKGPRQVAGLITQAYREVGHAIGEGSARQIRAAGEAFGLGAEDMKAASKAWEARSARAGHPGDVELSGEDLLHARAATRAYLGAYFLWRAERRPEPDG